MESGKGKNIKGLIYGLIFGSLSPIPGISLGSLGIFMNIFEKIFHSVTVTNIKKNLVFTFLFLLGWGSGLFWVSNIIDFLLENYGQLVLFSFKGLILGCVPMIFRKAKALPQEAAKSTDPQEPPQNTNPQEPVRNTGKIKPKNIVIFTVSLIFMLFIAFSAGDISANRTIEQFGGISPGLLVWLFFASFFSSMAMLIPGVGGSLAMLVFGIYTVFIEAVSTLNPVLLLIFGSSLILGILTGIKIIQKILVSYSNLLYSSILGFIIGSAFFIYPGFSVYVFEGILSIALAAAFAILAYRLSKSR